jgi:hypothetical protein
VYEAAIVVVADAGVLADAMRASIAQGAALAFSTASHDLLRQTLHRLILRGTREVRDVALGC